MSTQKLFGDMTPQEIEEFEKDSKGVIIFNGLGENAISFQESNGSIVFYVDKIMKGKNGKEHDTYPNLFLLDKTDIVKLFNFLSGLIQANPQRFHLQNNSKGTES